MKKYSQIILMLVAMVLLPIISKAEPLTQPRKSQSQTMIFVSFSMPEQSLREWLIAGEKIKAPVIIRGLINNSFKETAQRLIGIMKKSKIKTGIQIDPEAFKRFDIQTVPAVVVTAEQQACPPDTSCATPKFNKVYGDITLEYALEKLRSTS